MHASRWRHPLALCAALSWSTGAWASSLARCSQLEKDLRVTGLEAGVMGSSATTLAGAVFLVVDRKLDALPALLLLNLVSFGPYLSSVVAGGCVVDREHDPRREDSPLQPSWTRESARAARAGLIHRQAALLGVNLAASIAMLLAARGTAARIALATSSAIPLTYAVVSLGLGRFSRERPIDESLPGGDSADEVRLSFGPELAPVTNKASAGWRLRCNSSCWTFTRRPELSQRS